MPNTRLLLGPVLFDAFEVPAGINFGGAQRVVVHRLPGGTRVMDMLGRDDANIRFSGIFSGPNATARARLVDELRAAGIALPLTWDVFFYTVVIASFEADFTASGWIPYSITCSVIRDEAAALIDAAVSLGATLLSDVASATSAASSAGLDLSYLATPLSDSSATRRDTAAFGAAQSALTGAQSKLSGAVGNAQAQLPATTLTSPGPAVGAIGALNAAVPAAQQLGQLSVAQAYIGRAATNLANAST